MLEGMKLESMDALGSRWLHVNKEALDAGRWTLLRHVRPAAYEHQ